MKTAAAILGEANKMVPEPSGYQMGAEGKPSRFATVLMDLLDHQAKGVWEMKLLRLDMDPHHPTDAAYRGVFRFDSGELLAFSDNEAVIASDPDQVLRHPDNTFAGVWDGRDHSMLSAVMLRSEKGLLPPAGVEMPNVALTPDEERLLSDNAERWGVETARALSIPEQELLAELKNSKESFTTLLNARRSSEKSDPEPIDRVFQAP